MILETSPSHQIQIKIWLQPPQCRDLGWSRCVHGGSCEIGSSDPKSLPPALSFQSCGLAPGQRLTHMKTSLFKGVPPACLFVVLSDDLQEGEVH